MSGHAVQIFQDFELVQTAFSHKPSHFFDDAVPPHSSRPPLSSQKPDPTQSSFPFFCRIMPKGRSRGVVNYRNEILINIVSNLLPNGEYAWQAVATAYQAESGKIDPAF